MLRFETNGKHGEVAINLPTRLDEITPEYLNNVTKEVEIANNYSLIALCHKEKLSAFVLAGRGKKEQMSTAVVPLFIKRGNVDDQNKVLLMNCGDTILITPTAISMGLHCNIPKNDLNMGKFMAILKDDTYGYQKAAYITDEVYFLEFKIVPNCDILGYYNKSFLEDFVNPFKIEVIGKGEQGE